MYATYACQVMQVGSSYSLPSAGRAVSCCDVRSNTSKSAVLLCAPAPPYLQRHMQVARGLRVCELQLHDIRQQNAVLL